MGADGSAGFAERTERLVLVLLMVGLLRFVRPVQCLLDIGLWAVAVLSWLTFGQRVWSVRGQLPQCRGRVDGGSGRHRLRAGLAGRTPATGVRGTQRLRSDGRLRVSTTWCWSPPTRERISAEWYPTLPTQSLLSCAVPRCVRTRATGVKRFGCRPGVSKTSSTGWSYTTSSASSSTGREVAVSSRHLGHFGNWDHCGAWASAVGLPLTTVAERLRPESLFDRFVAYRESLGMEVLPLTGGDNVSEVLACSDCSTTASSVCCPTENSQPGESRWTCLAKPARLPAGPALLAVRTGATLMPALSYYSKSHTHLEFLPEIVPPEGVSLREKVQVMTQQFADVIGVAARAHPTDWHMLQPVWSADRNSS